MSRYANLADLPLRIDDWSLAPHRRDTSSDF
jgi:hypothetical protein